MIFKFDSDLRLHNVSIHRNFHQNQFINECARSFLWDIEELTFLIIQETVNKLINKIEIKCRKAIGA